MLGRLQRLQILDVNFVNYPRLKAEDFFLRLKRKIKSIENMIVKTDEEWQIVRDNFRCPKCGSEDWDID